MLYDINTKYDPEGDHEEKYVKIKQSNAIAIAKTTARQFDESDEDSDNDRRHKQKPAAKQKAVDNDRDPHEIKRGRVGIIMPPRNAFDFTKRPGNMKDDSELKKKSEGRQRLRKVMEGLKRAGKQNFSNKRMQIVKSDQ